MQKNDQFTLDCNDPVKQPESTRGSIEKKTLYPSST